MSLSPLSWDSDKEELLVLDQRLLPVCKKYLRCGSLGECRNAIANMALRGAPLIGIAAMWGAALWLKNHPKGTLQQFKEACHHLASARPTAVNLAYELKRCIALMHTHRGDQVYRSLVNFIQEETQKLGEANQCISRYAAGELEKTFGTRPLSLMTLCNTGVLACGRGRNSTGDHLAPALPRANRNGLCLGNKALPTRRTADFLRTYRGRHSP